MLAALFVVVLAANLLWPAASTGSAGQPRLPPGVSPFPQFTMGPILHAVTVDPNANLSLRLLLTSLQGLVNRAGVELYLNVTGVAGNTTAMLSYLATRFNVTHDDISTQTAIDAYARRASSLVVFDPSRPESIDIGTMIAAQYNALLVGPDLAGWLNRSYNLSVSFDYAGNTSWSSLDAIGAYDRALRDLYPSASKTLLAILPPDRWPIRDYLYATKTFVFYHPQGALASPFESAATMRILEATPRGIPIVGWFPSPTLTEENSFVQMASGQGKFVVGVQDVPNLSVLTALGRNETHRQVAPPSVPKVLGNKAYVVVAVPDGDNIDFAAGLMRDRWAEPVRGTMPLAWSLNPLLVDLAPPLLDLYYETASPLDQFIAAPSGAGYLYPDYTGSGDLASFANFSKRYLDAADMHVLWLLNAFPASEIPYSAATLSAYVDGVRPAGIVLDYDDQPKTRDLWMQAGSSAVAPVARSTHFWTTDANVLGKLGPAIATWDNGPHFIWLTVYTFRFNLQDARTLVAAVAGQLQRNLEVVTPSEFFGLLRQDFVRSAKAQLAAAEGNPIAPLLFGSAFDSARARLREADGFLAAGDANSAAYAAYLALEDLRGVSAAEALLASLLVLLAGGVIAFLAQSSSGSEESPSGTIRPGMVLLVAMTVALLTFALREALEQNFWTYPMILIAIGVAGIHRPVHRFLGRAYPDRAPVAAALLDLVFVALAIRTSVAFPLALVATLLVVETSLARRPGHASELLAGLTFGVALGFLGGFDLPTFTALAVLLVVATLTIRGAPIPESPSHRPRALLPGFLLALPLSGLSVAFYYSLALRLQVQGPLLLTLAGSLLILAPTLAVLARRIVRLNPSTATEGAALALAAVFGGISLLTEGAVPTFLALLGLLGSLAYATLDAMDAYERRGGDLRRTLAVAILFFPLIVLFFRMPPIVYSLLIAPLPAALEYALYAPTVMISATALALTLLVGLQGRFQARLGKDYPAEPHGGDDGP